MIKSKSPEDEHYEISSDSINSEEANKVLNYSNTFAVFDRSGNIIPHGKMVQGIYHDGTRFINNLMLKVNGQKPLLLSSSIKEGNSIFSADLTNHTIEKCGMLQNSIHITRHQFVREGSFYEKIRIIQYEPQSCSFNVSLSFDSDFKDLFEIRGMKRTGKPNKIENKVLNDESIENTYLGQDGIKRSMKILFKTNVPLFLNKNEAVFQISLEQNKEIVITYRIDFGVGEKEMENISFEDAKKKTIEEIGDSRSLFAEVETANEHFNNWLYRSEIDLIALLADTSYGKYPYAGVPWYNTPFGRDGLITAIETLWIAPHITKDVLIFLANNQAEELILEKDAEPGKILHEARNGEMANTGEVPFQQYYGTIDATPLFVILAGMYFERTADLGLIKEIWLNIKAALKWIDEYGDIDNDGFVEYIHKAENGLTNQGWKDSFDSIMHENNELAEPPIALCEVQSYVYGAKNHAAILAMECGEKELSQKLKNEADLLKEQFNEQFWDERLGCYVLALDGHKKPCRVVSSNAGHALFTGIADEDKANVLAKTLLSPEMFSGWGIRTLSETSSRFNPMSYHNGSIWPHDNALVAYGFSKYGFKTELLKVMKALFDASLYIDMQRMPELYCGFKRRKGEGPTAYPVACSPQAWSVGAVFLMLKSCLSMEINAINKTIVFDKIVLPDYLEEINISNLILGEGKCSFTVKRLPTDVGFNLIEKPEDWEVIIKK